MKKTLESPQLLAPVGDRYDVPLGDLALEYLGKQLGVRPEERTDGVTAEAELLEVPFVEADPALH